MYSFKKAITLALGFAILQVSPNGFSESPEPRNVKATSAARLSRIKPDWRTKLQERANINKQRNLDMLSRIQNTPEWNQKMSAVQPKTQTQAIAARQAAPAKFNLSPVRNTNSEAIQKPKAAAAKTAGGVSAQGFTTTLVSVSSPFVFNLNSYPDAYTNYVDRYVHQYVAPIYASFIQIDFSFIELENGYDYVSVTDADGYECARFTGRYSSGIRSTACPGNIANVYVHTDSSFAGNSYYGFDIAGYTYSYDEPNTPPIAFASASTYSAYTNDVVQFEGRNSYDPDFGDYISAYSWNFGDGSYSTHSYPTKSYTLPGTYLVTLTVYDSSGFDYDVDSFYVYVSNRPNYSPTAIATASTYNTNNGVDILFTGSASFDSDPYDSIAALQWNFGDGATSTSATVYHYYYSPGTYLVTLTVWDVYGLSDTESFYVTINQRPNSPPIANGTASPSSANLGQTVNFDAASSSDIDSIVGDSVAYYYWDFGDGTASTVTSQKTASHYYSTPGTYAVILMVWDESNASHSRTINITVNPIATPTNLSFTFQGLDKLRFSWTGGSNNSAYKVVVVPGTSTSANCSQTGVDVSTNSYEATGLTAGTNYAILVCGYANYNSQRWYSATSLAGTKATLAPPAAPLPVTISSIAKQVNGSYKVSFTPLQSDKKYRLVVKANLNTGTQWATSGLTAKTGTQVDNDGSGKITFTYTPANGSAQYFFGISASDN